MNRMYIALFAASAIAASALPASGQALTPFSGNWKGAGSVMLDTGQREKVSCKSDNGMLKSGQFAIVLRCATAGGRIELRSKVKETAGVLKGEWRDVSYNNEGTIGGTVAGGVLDARISGPVINGSVKVRRDGEKLHVNAALSKGVKSISVSMTK